MSTRETRAKGKTETISIRVTAEMKERLTNLAEREYRTLSMQVEYMLRECLEGWEKASRNRASGKGRWMDYSSGTR